MNQLSLMTYPFSKKTYPIQKICDIASASDIHSLDIFDIKEKELDEYLNALESYSIHINSYIIWMSAFSKEKKYLPLLEEKIRRASLLKSRYLMIVPYSPFIDDIRVKFMKKEDIFNKEKTLFQHAIEIARKYGMEVCFETTPQPDIHLCHSDEILRMLSETDGLHLIFDTANCLPSGEQPLDAYEKLHSYISYVHLKDVKLKKKAIRIICTEYTDKKEQMIRCVLGEGEVPISSLYKRMLEDGYQGDFALEYVTPKESNKEANVTQLKRFRDNLSE